MDISDYQLVDSQNIMTPQLVYYQDIFSQNLLEILKIAGDPKRLWPHVKTHKMAELIRFQQAHGLNRFKCATLAEARMLAECQAEHILLAYPLVGPGIERFCHLAIQYPRSTWWALGDQAEQLNQLSSQASKSGLVINVLIDVNVGMNRTGIAIEASEKLYRSCYHMPGLRLRGFHCYDGHNNDPDLDVRNQLADHIYQAISQIRCSLLDHGLTCDILIMGGTPSFPSYSRHPDVYLSPGTALIYDYGYAAKYVDLPLKPAAAILSRVVSWPAPGLFTIDLGSKAIATDPAGARGLILGLTAEPVSQSEEHWVFRISRQPTDSRPRIGELLYVIPTHICPTTALYPAVSIASQGEIKTSWPVTARDHDRI